MAIFKITSVDSKFITNAVEHAFSSDTAGPDTLIVEQSAFLIATGADGLGAFLAASNLWTVTISGSVFSKQAAGLFLQDAGTAKITVGAEGEIHGSLNAIESHGSITLTNSGLIDADLIAFSNSIDGTNTISNTGTIRGGSGALSLASLNDKVTNSGTLVGKVQLGEGNNSLTNSGLIDGDINAGDGNDTIKNTGRIIGSLVELGEGNNSLTNSNRIESEVSLGSGNDTVINSGTIFGPMSLSGGNNKLTNSGTIGVQISAGTGNDVIVNSKLIDGPVTLDEGNNTLTNSGTISGPVTGGDGNDSVTNSKTINGTVDLLDGNNTLTNSGLIASDVTLGFDADKMTNSGTILGAVDLLDGSNTLTNSGLIDGPLFGGTDDDKVTNTGTITDIVDLSEGNDVFTGGAKVDRVEDCGGTDATKLMGGDDRYIATGALMDDGDDTVDGGAGVDIYDAGFSLAKVLINLDSVAHDSFLSGVGVNPIAAKTAVGDEISGTGKTDKITGFENATGGEAADIIHGNALANVLEGVFGEDELYGYAGNDTLRGGSENDTLWGGAGKDELEGGGGNDVFAYTATGDSTVSKAGRDVITDFDDDETGDEDIIDLSRIDANANTKATNDAFTLLDLNANFTKTAGELRAYQTATGLTLEGDVNGDGKADFGIDIVDATHSIVLSKTDGVDVLL